MMRRLSLFLAISTALTLVLPLSFAAAAPNASNTTTFMPVNPGVNPSATVKWNLVMDQALVTPLTAPSALTGPLSPLAWSDSAVTMAAEYTTLNAEAESLTPWSAIEAGVGPLTDGRDAWVIPGERHYDIAQTPALSQKGLASNASAANSSTVMPMTDGQDSWVIPR